MTTNKPSTPQKPITPQGIALIRGFHTLLGKRDPYSATHSKWVGSIAYLIAQKIKLLDAGSQKDFFLIGEIFDLGKIAWPDLMFTNFTNQKVGSVPLKYWMDDHSVDGPDIIWKAIKANGQQNFEWQWLMVSLLHHCDYPGDGPNNDLKKILKITDEWFGDRKGYDRKHVADALTSPMGHSVEDNQLRLKIGVIRVADSFVAGTSKRVYCVNKSAQEVIKEIEAGSDKQYHPLAVKAFKDRAQELSKLVKQWQ